MPICQWLREFGCPWNAEAVRAAAVERHVEVAVWLRDAGCPVDARIMSAAARTGDAQLCEALLARGMPWSQQGPNMAAWAGDAALARLLLLWLVQNLTGEAEGVQALPLTPAVFAAAARHGSVPLLSLLRDRGCEWDEGAWASAVVAGCEVVLDWPCAGHDHVRLPCASACAMCVSIVCQWPTVPHRPSFPTDRPA